MHYEGKLKIRSHNTNYCLIKVVTKAGLTRYLFFLIRKVQTESATGSVSVSKVRTTLTIRVETIDFDTQGCVLRVKGRNIQENQYVKVK